MKRKVYREICLVEIVQMCERFENRERLPQNRSAVQSLESFLEFERIRSYIAINTVVLLGFL
jgi:hypothetical protein